MERKILLTGDGSHTFYVPELRETYHSTHGAIQESKHVFIRNGLDYNCRNGMRSINVLEVGFGTGLNALLTMIYAHHHQISIEYQSIEAFPLSQEEILQLNYIDQLGEAFGQVWQTMHSASWNTWHTLSKNFQLRKIHARIQEAIIEGKHHLCYFDAFAPSKQPEMWEISILEKVRDSLEKGGTFVTYSSRGQLKRDLTSLGFVVKTLPGPPGKNEMIRAVRN